MKPNVQDYYIVIIAITTVVILAFWIHRLTDKNKQLTRNLKYYESTYLSLAGFASGWGNYNLVSLDGGKSWYAIEKKAGITEMLGPAERVFPGLLDHIKGMGDMANYVMKYGPISISDMGDYQRSLLGNAGITVENKETKPQ